MSFGRYTMKHWSFIVAVVLLLTLGCDPPPAEANLLQLCQQIDFYKKFKYSIGCLEFADYGCYCGPGGWGSPADSADACCMRHDKCYDQAKDLFTHCYPYVEYYNHKNGTCCEFSCFIYTLFFISTRASDFAKS